MNLFIHTIINSFVYIAWIKILHLIFKFIFLLYSINYNILYIFYNLNFGYFMEKKCKKFYY